MSKKDEALKLALEALEYIEHNYMSLPAPAEKAITAIREALAEQETVLPGGGHVPAVPVAVYGYCPECGGAGVMRERRPNGDDKCTNGHKYPSSKALAEQPAQPEQCECPACKVTPHASDCAVHNEPAYPKGACDCGAQPEQEPVAWNDENVIAYCLKRGIEAAKHIAPQPKEPEQEFITHKEGEDGWSEWVCPDPRGYLLKCCDCGLVHEAQFGVVRYKSEIEREDCDMVDDPNLQAVFRMRRSEQWSPEDTAHRAGGLPMEQPAQHERVQPDSECKEDDGCPTETAVLQRFWRGEPIPTEHYPAWFKPAQQQEPVAWVVEDEHGERLEWAGDAHSGRGLPTFPLYTSPPAQRKPLTDEQLWENDQIMSLNADLGWHMDTIRMFARAIEAAHGIKENT